MSYFSPSRYSPAVSPGANYRHHHLAYPPSVSPHPVAYYYSSPNHCFNLRKMLWDRTKQLPKELFKQVEDSIYGEHFPLAVRLHLAAWIEEKFSPSLPFNIEDPNHQKMAVGLAQQLLSQLEAKISAMPNDPDKFLMRVKLNEQADILRQTYATNPLGLFVTLRQCLEQEIQLVQQEGSLPGSSMAVEDSEMAEWIRQQIAILKQKVQETGLELDRCRQDQESFSVEYYALKENIFKFDSLLQQHGEQHPDVKRLKVNKESMEKNIKEKYYKLTHQRTALINAFVATFQSTKEVQIQVLDKELIRWKRDQQLAGNGFPIGGCLDVLQEWCEGLAEIIWTMRQQVRQLEGLQDKVGDPTQNTNILPELLAGITELLSNLVTGTFIIEKQPPQVMKTNTRFTATVRLLVGGVLNVHMAAPAVSVSIVSENQANQLLTSPSNVPKRKEDYNSGDILNGQGTMEYHAATKQVSVSFRNLQLKKIKRTEKKGTESVMDEKFSVLFWTEFQVGELKFQLWTMSLPVVVIVHGNQEPQALATITWDNAFAEWGRRPFCVPDKVTWAQMGGALNMKWTAGCGSPLTDDNLYYLACKAFRNNNLPRNPDDYNKLYLSWPMFCKEPLPERNFTFWEWFYRIFILTNNQMARLWKEGFIMGFVTKQAAENMLLQKQSGCFLLRFSDSELGGVTIAYVRKPDPYQSPSVFMVAPFTAKDLSQRSMADVIFDLQELTVLYPDTSKDVFKKFCSSSIQGQTPRTSDGYVKHMLVTQVEGGGYAGSSLESNPATPNNGYGMGYETPPMHRMPMAQSPLNALGGMGLQYNMDEMDMDDTNIDIDNSIDVRQILGLTEDFLPQSQPGNF